MKNGNTHREHVALAAIVRAACKWSARTCRALEKRYRLDSDVVRSAVRARLALEEFRRALADDARARFGDNIYEHAPH